MAGISIADDDWLAKAIGGLDFSGEHTGKIMLTAEQIKASRLAQQQKQLEIDQLIQQARDRAAYRSTVPGVFPEQAPITGYNTTYPPYTGDLSDPENTGMAKINIPQTDPLYTPKRNYTIALGNMISGAKPEDMGKLGREFLTSGQVLLGGMPATQNERDTQQFQMEGKWPSRTPEPYAVIGPNGETVRVGNMLGENDQITGQPLVVPPGHNLVRIGAPSLDSLGGGQVFKSPEAARTFVNEQAWQLSRPGGAITADPNKISQALSMGYGDIKSRIIKDATGREVEVPLPLNIRRLTDHINERLAPAGAAPGAAAPPGVAAPPGSTAGAPSPPAPGAAPPAPRGAPPAAPGPAVDLGLPPGYQTQAPPTEQVQLQVARIANADRSRIGLQNLIGYGERTRRLAPDFYVPDWMAWDAFQKTGGTGLGNAASQWLDPRVGQYMNWAKSFVEPVLRIASGAAIRPEEYVDYYHMFVPMPGDPPVLVKQKLDNMKAWVDIAGRAATPGQAQQMIDEIVVRNTGDAKFAADLSAFGQMLRVKATEAGTSNVRKEALPDLPEYVKPGGGASLPQYTGGPAAPATPGAVDHDAVNRIMQEYELRRAQGMQ
jgi:hypothetical protein